MAVITIRNLDDDIHSRLRVAGGGQRPLDGRGSMADPAQGGGYMSGTTPILIR